MAEAVNPGMDRYNRYYNSVLAQLQQDAGPERSDSQLKNYLQKIIRPTYDQAIAQRQLQTGQANAAIDTDAGSRGMGTSTWVTDAKMRQRNQEAADVANLNSNYNSTLYDALLNQLNQRDQYRLSLMSQAQGIAGNMYDRWKAEDDALAAQAAGGGGGGAGGGAGGGGGRNPGSKNPGGEETDEKYGLETPDNVLAHEAAHLTDQYNLKKNGATSYDMTGFKPKTTSNLTPSPLTSQQQATINANREARIAAADALLPNKKNQGPYYKKNK